MLQDAKVLGHRRLRDPGPTGQRSHSLLAVATQTLEDRAARRIARALKSSLGATTMPIHNLRVNEFVKPQAQCPARGAVTIGLLDGEVAPARYPLDAKGDDREAVELHVAVLWIARAEQRLGPVVLGALGEDLGRAAQHDPAEPGPLLVIAIANKSGDRVFDDVFEALERPRVALRLLIDRDVERALADDKAHRHEMRSTSRICGREMTDPATRQKAGLLLGQHPGLLHDFGSASQVLSSVASFGFLNQRGRP